ncbi:hypothetical protein CSB20_02110 [bacterium DOLZORAL124_64_63]|nr:MAG: hypothetical protein CSB20_02110 [bacterium DOLZORAL124_64_63]
MGVLAKPTLSCDAVVLRAFPSGETSVIASLLTRTEGFVKVVAKAARRPRSRLRPLVEPGRLVSVELSWDPARELQYLRGGSVRLDPLLTGVDLERSAFLLAALELTDRCRLNPGGEAAGGEVAGAEAMFGVCDAFIRMLSSGADAEPARLFFAFEWLLLKNHGLDPEVVACAVCGRVLDYSGDGTNLWFQPAEGGAVCHLCGGAGRPLSREALAEFRLFETGVDAGSAGRPLSRILRRELGAHLHHFLGFHLPGYRLPVALDLLRPVRRAEESSS